MQKVAKLVIIDTSNSYLLLYRSNHPIFGNDPDLPGGTLEGDESVLEALVREVHEETGVTIDTGAVKNVYSGTDYSSRGTHYSLFITRLAERPEIIISWEHSSFRWLTRNKFLEESKSALDAYMHMASVVLDN